MTVLQFPKKPKDRTGRNHFEDVVDFLISVRELRGSEIIEAIAHRWPSISDADYLAALESAAQHQHRQGDLVGELILAYAFDVAVTRDDDDGGGTAA
jgi:hypothetical protein